MLLPTKSQIIPIFYVYHPFSFTGFKMDNSNHTTYNSNIHYEANQPKLQWLLILIPVTAIFALYTAYRVRNKRRKRKQLLEEASTAFHASSMRRNTLASIDLHSGILSPQQINNASNISLVRLPQSGDVYVSVHTAAEERRVHQAGSTIRRESTSPAVITAPPPTYSVCSPPKYEDVVHLRTKDDDNGSSP